MNIITKKVRLVPAPFVGSILTVNIVEGLTFKIRSVALAEEHAQGIIDWGDSKKTTVTADSTDVEHLFPTPGEYTIRFSDDFSEIGASYSIKDYTSNYAPLVRGFTSNASRLTGIPLLSFCCCSNMTLFDVSESSVEKIDSIAFMKCTSLQGELFFPRVTNILGSGISEPFKDCTGITALHFARANAEAVKSSAAYIADPTLGTGVEDICQFDL